MTAAGGPPASPAPDSQTPTRAAPTRRPAAPSHAKRNLALVGAAMVAAWSLFTLDIDYANLLDLPSGLVLLISEMFFVKGPEWSYLPHALEAMVESLEMAWFGTVIGAIISLPLGFFGARNVSSGPASLVIRQLLNAIRAFPELVLAVAIFIPIAGLGPVAGALAIGLHSVGTLGKLTAEVIEGIDAGPVEAARAAGANGIQVQRWGVLPQVLPEIAAFWLYRFEINIRASAVLGVVGAGGIGFVLQQTLSFHRYPQAGTALLVVVVATIIVDTLSGWVRRRIIEGAEVRRVTEVEVPELAAVVPARP